MYIDNRSRVGGRDRLGRVNGEEEDICYTFNNNFLKRVNKVGYIIYGITSKEAIANL